ncbi:MAG: hypothetical protein H6895_14820 [Defluviimonas sp.]|uniref:hypothetical protein n=1 Tax=Albidovulum sp. TaxID=1872424 RepID=UPI001DA22BF1|nr:hypothetical protein [Paracoccaceae bacterium]MCC0065336.1 hypothetical protein [Defluviimonas sp.]
MPASSVLTGDLIGSGAAGPEQVERAMDTLRRAAGEISAWQGGADVLFTRHRGDGWQILITEAPWLCLRAALFIIAGLRAAKDLPSTRISIGLGAANPVRDRTLAAASGEAFELSGQALDKLRGHTLALSGPAFGEHDAIILVLIEERIRRWTPEQAEAVALALPPDNPTLARLAARLGISTQAVSYRLKGAGAPALRQALATWESELAERLGAAAAEGGE